MVGYPYLSLLYVIMPAVVLAANLVGDPRNSWPGFLVIVLGLPGFFYWKRKQAQQG